MAFLIGGANSAAETGFDVDNSCRFNDGDTAYMSGSFGTPTNAKKWTFSVWIKAGDLGVADPNQSRTLLGAGSDGNNYCELQLLQSDRHMSHTDYTSGSLTTSHRGSAMYRDPTAWSHHIFAYDSTQGTAANRFKYYVNGAQISSFEATNYPDEDAEIQINKSGVTFNLGRSTPGANYYWDGYMAEVVFVDGTQYAASDFGEYDEDSPTIWKPKDVSTLTFGNNGFYLDFEDSSNLGNNAGSGLADLTENNLAATDQSTDTCTNNFNVMLAIMKQASNLTFSEGNLAVAYPSANTWRTIYSSIMPTAGKWYWEVKPTASADRFVGIVGEAGVDNTDDSSLGVPATAYSIKEDGNKYNNNSSASYGVSTTTNDIVGVAMDLDNGTVWFSKNGTWMNSATQAEVAAGTTTNAAYSSITVGATYPFGPAVAGKGSVAFSFNFVSPPYAISSGNADGNGYGNFEYAVPGNFYSLCTKNLAEYG